MEIRNKLKIIEKTQVHIVSTVLFFTLYLITKNHIIKRYDMKNCWFELFKITNSIYFYNYMII